MREQSVKFTKVVMDDLHKLSGISVMKNFIVSSEKLKYPKVPAQFEYPYIFEGIGFIICKKGQSKIKINLVEYEVTDNTIITIIPNTIVEIIDRNEERDKSAEFLIFSPEFLSNLRLPPNIDFVEKVEAAPCIKVSSEECDNFLDFHTFIVKQYERTDHQFRVEIVKALLMAMLIEIASIYKLTRNHNPPKLSHHAQLVRQFWQLLIKHHKTERSVSFYADKMCLSSKYLSKIIKEASGKSMLEWINESVILTSKALLKSSDMTALQISEELNFPNPSFFGRYFKKYTGMTPIEYRDRRVG